MLDDALMLAPKQNVDYRNLSGQPTPEDFFLLSRIRGSVSVGQVCSSSGLGKAKTLEGLERLIDLGLVEVEGTKGAEGAEGAELMGRGNATMGAPAPPRPATQRPIPSLTEETKSSRIEAKPPRPTSPPKPVKPVKPAAPRESHSSFAPILSEGADDDLFEPDSPAHLSKIRASVGVDHEAADDELFGGAAPVETETDDDLFGGRQGTDDDLFSGKPVTNALDDDLFGGRPEVRPTAQAEKPAPAKISLMEDEEPASSIPPNSATTSEPDFGNARFPVKWSDFQIDSSAVLTGPDLSTDFKKEILYVHSQLEGLNYYELMGGEQDGDARSFKKTYIKLSKKFHPDVFYGKDAGEFKSLSESIFKAVTKAYQTLSNSKKRAEYDASLQTSLAEDSVASGLDSEHRRQLAFQTLVRRGYSLEEAGDFGLAVNEYRRALGVQRDDALLLRCGTLLLHAGMRLDEAATYARAVIETSPNDPEAWLLLGKIYERNNLLESALEAFERAADCAPQETSLRVHVERLRASIG